jgi:hypothetical protein
MRDLLLELQAGNIFLTRSHLLFDNCNIEEPEIDIVKFTDIILSEKFVSIVKMKVKLEYNGDDVRPKFLDNRTHCYIEQMRQIDITLSFLCKKIRFLIINIKIKCKASVSSFFMHENKFKNINTLLAIHLSNNKTLNVFKIYKDIFCNSNNVTTEDLVNNRIESTTVKLYPSILDETEKIIQETAV